jgi:hypothetical protein
MKSVPDYNHTDHKEKTYPDDSLVNSSIGSILSPYGSGYCFAFRWHDEETVYIASVLHILCDMERIFNVLSCPVPDYLQNLIVLFDDKIWEIKNIVADGFHTLMNSRNPSTSDWDFCILELNNCNFRNPFRAEIGTAHKSNSSLPNDFIFGYPELIHTNTVLGVHFTNSHQSKRLDFIPMATLFRKRHDRFHGNISFQNEYARNNFLHTFPNFFSSSSEDEDSEDDNSIISFIFRNRRIEIESHQGKHCVGGWLHFDENRSEVHSRSGTGTQFHEDLCSSNNFILLIRLWQYISIHKDDPYKVDHRKASSGYIQVRCDGSAGIDARTGRECHFITLQWCCEGSHGSELGNICFHAYPSSESTKFLIPHTGAFSLRIE